MVDSVLKSRNIAFVPERIEVSLACVFSKVELCCSLLPCSSKRDTSACPRCDPESVIDENGVTLRSMLVLGMSCSDSSVGFGHDCQQANRARRVSLRKTLSRVGPVTDVIGRSDPALLLSPCSSDCIVDTGRYAHALHSRCAVLPRQSVKGLGEVSTANKAIVFSLVTVAEIGFDSSKVGNEGCVDALALEASVLLLRHDLFEPWCQLLDSVRTPNSVPNGADAERSA